jgi:hypothetical protein
LRRSRIDFLSLFPSSSPVLPVNVAPAEMS